VPNRQAKLLTISIKILLLLFVSSKFFVIIYLFIFLLSLFVKCTLKMINWLSVLAFYSFICFLYLLFFFLFIYSSFHWRRRQRCEKKFASMPFRIFMKKQMSVKNAIYVWYLFAREPFQYYFLFCYCISFSNLADVLITSYFFSLFLLLLFFSIAMLAFYTVSLLFYYMCIYFFS
jgi:hypothetical protein